MAETPTRNLDGGGQGINGERRDRESEEYEAVDNGVKMKRGRR